MTYDEARAELIKTMMGDACLEQLDLVGEPEPSRSAARPNASRRPGAATAPRRARAGVLVRKLDEARTVLSSVSDETDGHRCPVGFCHPKTAARSKVGAKGEFCDRHKGVLSHPMQASLAMARMRGNATDLAKVLVQARFQARQNDRYWRPFVIVVDGIIEPCETWRGLVERFFELEQSGPVARGIETDAIISADDLRAGSPHTVQAAGGSVLATGETLIAAINNAHRGAWDARAARPVYEGGPPTVINDWTGERLDLALACQVAARGWK